MDWWADIDDEILATLERNGAMEPATLGETLGMSEAAVCSCLAMLAAQHRVRITTVAPVALPACARVA